MAEQDAMDLLLEIIRGYGAVLEQSKTGSYVYDTKELPYPKHVIKDALRTALKISKDEAMRSQFTIAYAALASWQDGVGNTPINMGFPKWYGDMKSVAEMKVQLAVIDKWQPIITAEKEQAWKELGLAGA